MCSSYQADALMRCLRRKEQRGGQSSGRERNACGIGQDGHRDRGINDPSGDAEATRAKVGRKVSPLATAGGNQQRGRSTGAPLCYQGCECARVAVGADNLGKSGRAGSACGRLADREQRQVAMAARKHLDSITAGGEDCLDPPGGRQCRPERMDLEKCGNDGSVAQGNN